MDLQFYEGTWEELVQHADELVGRRVRLILIDGGEPADVLSSPTTHGHLSFGMFSGEPEVTEEDFKSAEWHGEDIDI